MLSDTCADFLAGEFDLHEFRAEVLHYLPDTTTYARREAEALLALIDKALEAPTALRELAQAVGSYHDTALDAPNEAAAMARMDELIRAAL